MCLHARVMRRTTVMLPDDLDERIRLEARRRGVSVAQIAREALESYVAAVPQGPLSFFGIGDGSPPDASERVDEYVVRAVSRKFARRTTSRPRR